MHWGHDPRRSMPGAIWIIGVRRFEVVFVFGSDEIGDERGRLGLGQFLHLEVTAGYFHEQGAIAFFAFAEQSLDEFFLSIRNRTRYIVVRHCKIPS